MNIKINKNIVSLNVINENLIKPYKKLLLEKKTVLAIQITFTNEVNRLDELLYTYLSLICKKHNINKVRIDFSNQEPASKVLRLSVQYSGVLRKAPYELFLDIFNKGKRQAYFFEGSKEFLPPLLINQEVYDRLFIEERKNDSDLLKFIERQKIKNQLETIFKEITRKEEFKKAVLKSLFDTDAVNYAWRYMFKAFSHLNILRYLIQEKYNETVSDSLKRKNEFSFGKIRKGSTATHIIQDISNTLEKSQFYNFNYFQVFIFSILVQNSTLFDASKLIDPNDDLEGYEVYKKQYLSHLKYIIKYTTDISFGIEELSKNIIEHVSGTKSDFKGAITVRVLSNEGFNDITNSEKNQTLTNWKDDTLENEPNILQINVLDLGEDSVLETYYNNIESLILMSDDSSKVLLEEDLQNLKSGMFNISRFLDFTNIYLNHQVKRVYARLGLLIFSNLILDKKNGIIRSSSYGLKDISSASSYISFNNKQINMSSDEVNNTIELGTNYNINIPVNESFDEYRGAVSEDEVVAILPTSDSTLFVELFNYKYGNVKTDFSNSIALLDIDLSIITERDKYEKIKRAKELINHSISVIKDSKDIVVVIDAKKCSNIINNSSDWVRLLGSLHIENPEKNSNIIIKRVNENIHNEIISLNKLFKDTKFGFWSDNDFILFFVEVVNNNNIFYFNDLLTSKDYMKYVKLNKNISNYHLNMFLITEPDYDEKDLPNEEMLFTNNILKEGRLLNFELLLKADEYLTIYEKTAHSFLNIEIKDKI
ncbi:hypothetical protein [Kordia sp.]|uniref:hypothetical protein n=1 Tax=Kordia sp. TaxID=1965332 RepID=UPI003D6AA303